MFQRSFVRSAFYFGLLFICLSTVWQPMALKAQSGDNVQQLHQQLSELIKQQNYVQALPVIEKLIALEPNDPENHFYLGFALIAQANTIQDSAARKAVRVRARNAFIRSKELGVKEPVVDALIQAMPLDGSAGKDFSPNVEANRLMTEAEAFFSKGQLSEALRDYQMALQLDPRLYEAALFSGDVYVQQGNFPLAESWYQKAISIDPNRETAYRYSATPLMKQGKYTEARDRYVEAYIAEPYSKFSVAGLTQWAQETSAKLAHPNIEIPVQISLDDKGNLRINLDSNVMAHGENDGSSAWISYGTTRSSWQKEKFAQRFPSEKTYRHSLPEEVEALRSVLTLAAADKSVKALNPSLLKLKKLNDEGLLEAYILMARADQGIAKDYPEYLKQNREKLRRYVVEYVLTGGGA